MARKIFRSGNSLAVTLPPDVLVRLGITKGSMVEVTEDLEGRCIVITATPTPYGDTDEDFVRHVDEFIEQYRPALESLAKR